MDITIDRSKRYSCDPLYQWDTNVTLNIKCLSTVRTSDVIYAPEIHFSNDDLTEAIVKQSTITDNGCFVVKVPDVMLQRAGKFDVYVFSYDDQGNRTRYQLTIDVIARKKPADYVAEDDEKIYSYNELENKLENAINEATAELDNAKTIYAEIVGDFADIYEYMDDILNTAVESGAFKGDTGVGIKSVNQTVVATTDGGTNTFLITLTNGDSFEFNVRNGSKGSKGDKGDKGDKGEKGEKGDPGDSPAGGGGVSSWNDLTDKPFGDMETVLASEKLVTYEDNRLTDLNSSMVYDGMPLVVYFDGTRYETTVVDFGEGIGLATAEYPEQLAGTATIPFALIFKTNYTNVIPVEYGRENTISIYTVEIVKIDNKYLPDNNGGNGGFQIVTLDMETMTCDKSGSEIFAMLQTAPVALRFNGLMYFVNCEPNENGEQVTFSMNIIGGTDMLVLSITVNDDKSVTIQQIMVTGQAIE